MRQVRTNKISRKGRYEIYERDHCRCTYCGCEVHPGASTSDPAAATLDHLECHSAGGKWDPSNLVTCCAACNRARGTMRLSRWVAVAAAAAGITTGAMRSRITRRVSCTR